jgi:hypothetical protein
MRDESRTRDDLLFFRFSFEKVRVRLAPGASHCRLTEFGGKNDERVPPKPWAHELAQDSGRISEKSKNQIEKRAKKHEPVPSPVQRRLWTRSILRISIEERGEKTKTDRYLKVGSKSSCRKETGAK